MLVRKLHIGGGETNFENCKRWKNWKSKWELVRLRDKIRGDFTKEGAVKKCMGKVEKQKD